MRSIFKDKIPFNFDEKNLISARDGYQEYLGLEFNDSMQKEYNLIPTKRYKVYRSTKTLESLLDVLDGIPITDEHIEIEEIPNDVKQGKIISSELIDNIDTTNDSTKAIKNGVLASESMIKLCQSGKSELSLGYTAKIIKHNIYDFEQVDIKPHHLALVQNGRCGKACKILDKGIEVIFINEDGTLNQDNIKMALEEMPKAIELMSDEEKAKLFEFLGGIMPVEEVEDEKMDEIKDCAIAAFKDSADFQKMMDSHAHAMSEAVIKANNWIDGYESKGKSLNTVMRDTLAVAKEGVEFKDCELPVAFKMLDSKPTEIVTKVADSKPSKWQEIKLKD